MLYMIRHGRTDWNNRRKIQGQTDVPLNDEGREMARKAAAACAEIPFDVCFCSPLDRAKETAEILLAGRQVPIVFDERLKEMSFGIYEGIEKSFDIPDCPINRFFFTPAEYVEAVEGGESTYELLDRVSAFLTEQINPRLERGEHILIVGHGAVNEAIYCKVMERPVEEFFREPMENCRLIRLK